MVVWGSRGVDSEDIDNIYQFWISMKCNVPEGVNIGSVMNVNLSITFKINESQPKGIIGIVSVYYMFQFLLPVCHFKHQLGEGLRDGSGPGSKGGGLILSSNLDFDEFVMYKNGPEYILMWHKMLKSGLHKAQNMMYVMGNLNITT